MQGNVETANLGDLPGALAQDHKALPLLDDAIRRNRQTSMHEPSSSSYTTGSQGCRSKPEKMRDALGTFQDAIARASIPAASRHPELRLALADAHLGSSLAKRNLGEHRGAVEAATEGCDCPRSRCRSRSIRP